MLVWTCAHVQVCITSGTVCLCMLCVDLRLLSSELRNNKAEVNYLNKPGRQTGTNGLIVSPLIINSVQCFQLQCCIFINHRSSVNTIYRNHIVQVALTAFPQGLKREWLSSDQLVKKEVGMKISGLLHFVSFCVNAVQGMWEVTSGSPVNFYLFMGNTDRNSAFSKLAQSTWTVPFSTTQLTLHLLTLPPNPLDFFFFFF